MIKNSADKFNMTRSLVDSHCHLHHEKLIQKIPDIIENCKKKNISSILNVSIKILDYKKMFSLLSKYDNVYFSIGSHPCYKEEISLVEKELSLCKKPRVIAIGESGLDMYKNPHQNCQIEKFKCHIHASEKFNLPLIIHSRNAENETIQCLQNKNIRGVLHCFTGSLDFAKKCLQIGLYISFSGIITFEDKLREVVSFVPLEKILIETDSPYLAPRPHRGKVNEPSHVIEVARKIAEIKNIPMREVIEKTSENFFTLFNIAR